MLCIIMPSSCLNSLLTTQILAVVAISIKLIKVFLIIHINHCQVSLSKSNKFVSMTDKFVSKNSYSADQDGIPLVSLLKEFKVNLKK